MATTAFSAQAAAAILHAATHSGQTVSTYSSSAPGSGAADGPGTIKAVYVNPTTVKVEYAAATTGVRTTKSVTIDATVTLTTDV